jgi:drug/metabolite transporter (DMT)-like permease
MPSSVVLLVVASAIAHAAWNAILKRCNDPENAVVGMMAVAGCAGLAAAVVLRVPPPMPASTAWCLVSGALEACYFVTLARALSRAPLGSVYVVVRGGALIVVWPISVLVLGEQITGVRALGALLVVLGLMATGAAEISPPRRPALAEVRSGLAVAAICALFVGGYHVAYKLALSAGGRPEGVVAVSLTSASALNIATLGRQRRPVVAQAVRAQPVRIVSGGLLAAVGFLVFLTAMKDAGAGVILTLRNTSILFAQIMALALGERPHRLGILGAASVTAGAVLLAR